MILVLDDPLPGLAVRQLNGSQWWLTLQDYEVRLSIDGCPGMVTVPAGYRYNRASIPEATPAWIINRDDLGCVGPLVHDVLYNQRGDMAYPPPGTPRERAWSWPIENYTRAQADGIFYALMIRNFVKPWRALLAYQMVRQFGRRW